MPSALKSTLLSGAILAGLLAVPSVEAADLDRPRRVEPPADFAPPYHRPVNYDRWAGFYLGGSLAYGWGEGRTSGQIGSLAFDQDGVLGTVFAGYNWQSGMMIYGLEADIGTGSLSASRPTAFGTLQSDLNALGSFRGRLGVLVTPSLMLYGTAGLAWADMDFNLSDGKARSETFMGYQIGLGSELMLSDKVNLRLEYIYTDLGDERVIHGGMTNNYDPDFHQIRAGIVLKF